MEENKATAYYDELLRKGGGAARFKQGLGYDAQSSDTLAANSSYPSSHTFVKGGSRDDNLAAVEKEIRLANVRDKLKKHDVSGSNNKSSFQKCTTNDIACEHDMKQGIEGKELQRLTKKSTTSPEMVSESLEHGRRGTHMWSSCHPAKLHPSFRSQDSDVGNRSLLTERKKRHKRQDSASGSGSSFSGDYRKSSYSSSEDSHNRGHRRRGRRRRSSQHCSSSEKRRNRSMMKHSRRSHSHSHSHAHSQQRSSSSADSEEKRKQVVKSKRRRTHNGSRRIKHSSRRSKSVSSRRSKSVSSSGCSSEDHHRSHWKPHVGSHRSSNQIHKCRSSPCMQRKEKSDFEKGQKNRRIVSDSPGGKKSTCDYSKVIPGFDGMSPAEKVKAKMKLQLSETVVKDSSKGMSGEWERFDFNKEAPLDDDAKLDYFGDGTETRDDTGFLQNTGSTFMSSNHQARREAQVQEAHDAAIFGFSAGKKTSSRKGQHSSLSVEESARDTGVRVQLEQNPPDKNLLSDQVIAMQQVSWRERASKLKE